MNVSEMQEIIDAVMGYNLYIGLNFGCCMEELKTCFDVKTDFITEEVLAPHLACVDCESNCKHPLEKDDIVCIVIKDNKISYLSKLTKDQSRNFPSVRNCYSGSHMLVNPKGKIAMIFLESKDIDLSSRFSDLSLLC